MDEFTHDGDPRLHRHMRNAVRVRPCRHCSQPIKPCEHGEISCLGWVHSSGDHVCWSEPDTIARAEPAK